MKTNFFFNFFNYRRPFLWALTFHLMLLVLFLFRFNFDDELHSPSSATAIVQATLVASPPVTEPMNPPVPAVQPPVEKEVITPMEQKLEEEKEPSHALAQKEQIQEPPPSAPPQKESIEESTQVQQEAEKALLLKKEQQTKKVAAEKQQRLEREKQQRLQTEIQQQLEKEQQQKKAHALAKKRQKEIEQLLQQDLVESQPVKSSAVNHEKSAVATGAKSRVDNKEIDRYKSLIISAISHQWIVPENVKTKLECHLKVRVAPGGVVMSVKLVKPSGNAALDRSAESAIYKASPLPVPKDAALFSEFREFNLVARPEGILAE